MKLLFMRHGQTDWNAQGRLQGRSDIPLNAQGRAQAQAQAEALKGRELGVEVIFSSPLQRAHETAEIIQAALDVPLHVDERLIEQSFGGMEGMRRGDLQGGSIFSHWTALGIAEFLRQDAEPFSMLYERVCDFLDDIAATYQEQTILVVAHGCVGRMVHWYFHGQDETDKTLHGNAVLRSYSEKFAGHRPEFIV